MKQILLILIVSSLLISCHKDQTSVETFYICPGIQNQQFKIGSYWIFRNDSTQATDCTYVDNVIHGFNDQYWGLNRSTSTEFYTIFYSYTKTINEHPRDVDRIEGWLIMRNPVQMVNHGYYGPAIYTCYHDSITKYLDSLKVGNITFYNVQRALIDSTDFYSAKSIGIVKKVIRDSINKGTWNIIRWKIIK
ncbi:MAG: hypothetical protein NTY96_10570 [Bacteroidetes bacterium]|nr:hypothetical protein [Bacteroidota bacterium]